MLTLLQDIKNEQLVSVLSEKFEDISKVLKSVTKIASKGHRKGLLIFTPEAPSTINALKDKFVKYVTRYIFDEYKDYTGGVLWRMHFNILFSDDIYKEIFARVNPVINALQQKLDELKTFEYNSVEYRSIYEKRALKFESYNISNSENVWNKNNTNSKPFYDAKEAFIKKVTTAHPRVKKLRKFIEDDYTYSREWQQIKDTFLNSFPEYVELSNQITTHYNNCFAQRNDIIAKIKTEMDSEGLTPVKKDIEKLVEQYCKIVTSKIISGKIE